MQIASSVVPISRVFAQQPQPPATQQFSFVKKVGLLGGPILEGASIIDATDHIRLDSPEKVATDSNGDIYIADQNDERVVKIGDNGTFITAWGSRVIGSTTGPGLFSGPLSIAVDPSTHSVYVAQGDSVQKFTSNGTFITSWGSVGQGNGQFNHPEGIAVDSATGQVYVVDIGNNRIQKFTSNGTFITSWGSVGQGNGQFNHPEGIAVDSATGQVYVVDIGNNRIQKFTSNGTFITSWGSGVGNRQLRLNGGIAFDASANRTYVSDNFTGRIVTFTANGTFVSAFPFQGGINGLGVPFGIALQSFNSNDKTGILVVADPIWDTVDKFYTNGTFISLIPPHHSNGFSTAEPLFDDPQGIAVGTCKNGCIYVSDTLNNRAEKLTGTGSLVTKWFTLETNLCVSNCPFYPQRIAVADGKVYTAQSEGYPIESFTGNGTATGFVLRYPTIKPTGIALDPTGKFVYIADSNKNQIAEFNSTDGVFIKSWVHLAASPVNWKIPKV